MSGQKSTVALQVCQARDYPRNSPFHPAEPFPEYRFAGTIDEDNWVYGAVRNMLRSLGLDEARFGTPDWNPLGELIRPADRVVIKPNLVISDHHLGDAGIRASVAHGSVIRPLLDYAAIAAGPRGRITICDSPIKEVDFAKVVSVNGIRQIIDLYANRGDGMPQVELLDIRDLQATRDANGAIISWKELAGDPSGYTVVDLANKSMLAEVSHVADRLRSTASVYESEARRNHTGTVNRYSFPNTILGADVIIGVAKLKVHRKAGVTLTLKNMVGTTNEKRWLPHHRAGTPKHGGDMCPDDAPPDRRLKELINDRVTSHWYGYPLRRWVLPGFHRGWKALQLARVLRIGRKYGLDIHEGDWFGNDTIWRTTLDLNMALLYADKQGAVQPTRQRRMLSVVDGIIGGEREGPLHPTPRPAGLLFAGLDSAAVDTVAACTMGFEPQKIPTLANVSRTALPIGTSAVEEIAVVSNSKPYQDWGCSVWPSLAFEPSAGWLGHIERDAGDRPVHSEHVGTGVAPSPEA